MKPYPKCLSKVTSAILQGLDTPRALTVHLLIENEEWDQLVRLNADPALYLTADAYYRDVIATDLLRKCKDLPTTIDRREVAVEGFWDAEKACHMTNLRINPFLNNGPFEDPSDVRILEFLERAKTWIARVLGRLPATLVGRHGPGATLNNRMSTGGTSIPDKMQSQPSITQNARCLLPIWYQTAWSRALNSDRPYQSDPDTVRWNRFTTVDKDATKDRGICIEPSINVFFQLGVGREMRSRLLSIGIDLEEGQDRHRQAACEASRYGTSATIDLSSASDTVSRKLVELLLPPDWYAVLATLRSPLTQVDKKQVYLEKFSSMGNGFTFELETLIFLALAVETANSLGVAAEIGRDILVYGDDIIVPVGMAKPLIAVLRWCGFTPNKRKTYTDGLFRESCGGDFFDGTAVRPHYLKEYPNDPASWISLANGIRRLATAEYSSGFHALPVQRAWFLALDNLPSDIRRCRGPVQLGDLLIHDEPEKWSFHKRNQTKYFRVWKPFARPKKLNKWSAAVQFASALYGVPSSGPVLRGSVGGYRFGRVPLEVNSGGTPGSAEVRPASLGPDYTRGLGRLEWIHRRLGGAAKNVGGAFDPD